MKPPQKWLLRGHSFLYALLQTPLALLQASFWYICVVGVVGTSLSVRRQDIKKKKRVAFPPVLRFLVVLNPVGRLADATVRSRVWSNTQVHQKRERDGCKLHP